MSVEPPHDLAAMRYVVQRKNPHYYARKWGTVGAFIRHDVAEIFLRSRRRAWNDRPHRIIELGDDGEWYELGIAR